MGSLVLRFWKKSRSSGDGSKSVPKEGLRWLGDGRCSFGFPRRVQMYRGQVVRDLRGFVLGLGKGVLCACVLSRC